MIYYKRIVQIGITILILEVPALAREISIKGATDSVMKVVGEVAAIIFPVLGLIGIGRAAFTFSTGGQGGTKELLEGIVGIALGVIAKTLSTS
ncbi:MAG: hypothetical protein KAS97_11475 [Candidatus Aminicenantes bacterium]|nr:hypothetical protein [Candidatus Aminicenantes bacterium]